ncbi:MULTISPECIES: hypothetical protein [Aeromonas]|uniref:hypothetical protein n=1 Tax=Aeromonas TaxID=642 RepID=UPI00168152FF|nr:MULTISPECIES: hypothetical protein [Aeromonas]BCK64038.1 hypothetical protein KAM330_30270 [Aeromonas hydrophila]GJA18913.1 hypothetical protein KAM336_19340 [Aeromonas caviae]GJA27514.1 hypothetical protein KAM340_16810 [Aeromonas caviae]GJA74195.1 hypothetical protein KAM353_38420 [Aeromonas caviae]
MEQEKIKQEPRGFFEQREMFSAQVAGKWARYRHWLKQSLRRDPPSDASEVNNNPYQRGGICSYNTYLSGMLRAHLWGLWLTAVIVLAWQFLLPRMGLATNYKAGLGIIMSTAIIGTFHWAVLVFMGYEKRLQASGLTDPLSRLVGLAAVVMTAAGFVIGWFISIERSSAFAMYSESADIARQINLMEGNQIREAAYGIYVKEETAKWLSELGYDSWILAGQVMLYVGLALIFLLPCYRNRDNLASETKEALGKVQGYPTPILLLFHLLLLFPAVAILA